MIFRRLEIYGAGLRGADSFGSDGIAISRGYPVLVEDCSIHDNGGDGIDLNSRDRDGYAQGVVVRRNQVERNHQNGIKVWAGGRIENNLVWGQGNSALWLGTFHGTVELINNTIAFNMWEAEFSGRNYAVSVGYPEEIVALPRVNLVMVNNIFAFNTGPDVGEPTGVYLGPGVSLTEHHNLFFSRQEVEVTADFLEREFSRQDLLDGTWAEQTGQGAHDLSQDPLFQSNWPEVNLKVLAGSPAIDAADNAYCPPEDAYASPRPIDGDSDGEAVCDIGAVEFGREIGAASLRDVGTWFYYLDVDLEDDTIERIIQSTYDMVVIDYIPSERDNADYPIAEVVRRMQQAEHPKLVIAYIDIGEAEDYRTYWQPGWEIGDPDWIIALDPDGWEGNYPVAYWREEYKALWLGEGGYLQGILDAGFDGVYLDWVEAYSDENVLSTASVEGIDPRREMIRWVGEIATYARTREPAFIVIAQNAAELIQNDDYVEIIDAIAQEQVWFDGGADNDPPGDCPLPATEEDIDSDEYYESLSRKCRRQFDDDPDNTLHMSSEEYLRDLLLARDKGLVIFTVDYATEPENIETVYRVARSLGFIPFVSARALDQYIEPIVWVEP